MMSNTRLEMIADAEPRQHGAGVISGAVGQDQLAPGQLCDRRNPSRGSGCSGEWSILCT